MQTSQWAIQWLMFLNPNPNPKPKCHDCNIILHVVLYIFDGSGQQMLFTFNFFFVSFMWVTISCYMYVCCLLFICLSRLKFWQLIFSWFGPAIPTHPYTRWTVTMLGTSFPTLLEYCTCTVYMCWFVNLSQGTYMYMNVKDI